MIQPGKGIPFSKTAVVGQLAIVVLVALLAVFPAMPFANGYLLLLIRLLAIYAIVTLGLNLCTGYCGTVHFGLAGFYALGAYIPVLLQQRLGLPFVVSVVITLVICWLISLALSIPILRLRHMAFALGTLAFAMVVWLLAERLSEFTGGENGLVVPKVIVFGKPAGDLFWYYLILVFLIISYYVCKAIGSSRVGRAMRAIREDELAAAAAGININKYLRLALAMCGTFASLGGALFAYQSGWVSTSTFGLWPGIMFVLMLLVGGNGSNAGAVLGAVVVGLLPHLLSFMVQYHVLAYGTLLALTIRFLPGGLWPALCLIGGRIPTWRKSLNRLVWRPSRN